jgi:hypothetical protein
MYIGLCREGAYHRLRYSVYQPTTLLAKGGEPVKRAAYSK